MWGGGELVHTVAPHCPPLARRLNTVVAQMWPYCARMAAAWAADNVDALLEQNKPTWIRSIALHRFSVGEACPEVSGVKVYDSNKSEGDEVRGGGAHRSACAHECTSPPAPPPRSSSSSTLCGQASSTFPLSPSPCPAPRRAPARLTAACAAAHVPAADARPPPPPPPGPQVCAGGQAAGCDQQLYYRQGRCGARDAARARARYPAPALKLPAAGGGGAGGVHRDPAL